MACMAIDGAYNGALLAVEILALKNGEVKDKLVRFRQAQADKVTAQDEALQNRGGLGNDQSKRDYHA